jgi:hypothetical protein
MYSCIVLTIPPYSDAYLLKATLQRAATAKHGKGGKVKRRGETRSQQRRIKPGAFIYRLCAFLPFETRPWVVPPVAVAD